MLSRKSMRNFLGQTDELFKMEALKDIKAQISTGKKPDAICASTLQIKDIQENTKTSKEQEYLMQLISDTFGEYMGKQSQMFQSAFRKLKFFSDELAEIATKTYDTEKEQEYIQNYFEDGIGKLDQLERDVLDLQQRIKQL